VDVVNVVNASVKNVIAADAKNAIAKKKKSKKKNKKDEVGEQQLADFIFAHMARKSYD
jgi:hypothetical protein